MLMDKGYDAEYIHEMVHTEMGCKAIIPVRRTCGNRGFTRYGFWRCRMQRLMAEGTAERG